MADYYKIGPMGELILVDKDGNEGKSIDMGQISKERKTLEQFIKENKLSPAPEQIKQDEKSKETMKKEKEEVLKKREEIKPKQKGEVEYKQEKVIPKEIFTPKAKKIGDSINEGMRKKLEEKKEDWGTKEIKSIKKHKKTLDDYLAE